MPRKQVGLKIEEEALRRWDAYAELHGYSRTTLIETALERFIAQTDAQAPQKAPESQVPTRNPRPYGGWGGVGGKPPIQKRPK